MRGTCDACGYPDVEVEEYGPAFGELFNRLGRRPRFCKVCASTFISQVETNPTNLMNPLFFYRTLGRVANMILEAIHELKTGRK